MFSFFMKTDQFKLMSWFISLFIKALKRFSFLIQTKCVKMAAKRTETLSIKKKVILLLF